MLDKHFDMGANTFLQEFISNPLLIDGYKFDIGVYVAITSLQPLRIYVTDGGFVVMY